MKHSFENIEKAFEFVSSAPIEENQAILNLETGEILHKSGMLDEEEFPEEVEASDAYIWIPHREDLDLGAGLVMDFVEMNLPQEKKTVKRMLKRKNAMIDFRAWLADRGMLENWRAFEKEETRFALLDWCDENGVEVDVED